MQTDPVCREKVEDKAVQTEISVPVYSLSDTGMELEILSSKYASICQKCFGLEVPNDFLVYAGAAMIHLTKNNRSNVLYNLAKGLGTLREDKKCFQPKEYPWDLLSIQPIFSLQMI